jgi:DNA-binding NarL/FixJ family response regulator
VPGCVQEVAGALLANRRSLCLEHLQDPRARRQRLPQIEKGKRYPAKQERRARRPAGAEAVDVALTERELEVLLLIADGVDNRGIAQALGLQEDTVKTHVRSLLNKCQARNRAAAVTVGFRSGWLE